MQFRAPNCEYVPGRHSKGSVIGADGVWVPPTKMPDFIGCAEFGSLGAQERSNCTVLVVPDDFQGANKSLVDALCAAAKRGVIPAQQETAKDKCVVLPTSFKGQYCRNSAIHGFEAVEVSSISCSARYQYLIHEKDGKPEWCIIIGYGIHSHVLPFARPSVAQTRHTVEETVKLNPAAQTPQLMEALVVAHGSSPSLATVRSRKYNFAAERNPFGRHLHGLVRMHRDMMNRSTPPYIWSIYDERLRDESRTTVDQVGVVVIMGEKDLVRRSVSAPHYGCDGTFNMVSQSGDLLNYELVSFTCKDPLTRVFLPRSEECRFAGPTNMQSYQAYHSGNRLRDDLCHMRWRSTSRNFSAGF